MRINIHDQVRVKLTQAGRDYLKRQQIEQPTEDESGQSIWQIWSLFDTFHPLLYNGSPKIPFDLSIELLRFAIDDADHLEWVEP